MGKGVPELSINGLDINHTEVSCVPYRERKIKSQYANVNNREVENDISRSCAECDFSKISL